MFSRTSGGMTGRRRSSKKYRSVSRSERLTGAGVAGVVDALAAIVTGGGRLMTNGRDAMLLSLSSIGAGVASGDVEVEAAPALGGGPPKGSLTVSSRLILSCS